MKTYNLHYKNFSQLKEFISNKKLNREKSILLQIFTGLCDVNYIENLVNDIKTVLPNIKIIGSTTSGEILEKNIYHNSTILSFSIFENTKVETYYTEFHENSYLMGKNLIEKFKNKNPKVAITFSDGLRVNGEEYLKSFQEYDKNLIIAGGLAGDNNNFKKTIVFTQDNIKNNGAVVALLYNKELIVHTKASFGWESIGKTMTITKAYKNIVYEIDGVNAVEIYKKYLGNEISKLLPKTGIEFPLIIKRGSLSIPRVVIGKGEDNSLIFAGNFKEGDRVTFGYGNIDAILQYSDKIANSDCFKNSEAIFIYSCMARLKLMKESISQEIEFLSQIAPVSGFFTYGEFFSNPQEKKYEMLNQTMTILSLSENKNKINPKPIKKSDFKDNLTLRALSNLIYQTSKELEEKNKELEKKIKEIKDRNTTKAKIIKKQTKLAQMGEMISIIAHQWKQPLSAISSILLSLQIILDKNKYDLNKKEEREKLLTLLKEKHNDIFIYLDNLSETIDDFRNFFKTDKKKDKITLTQAIDDALSILKTPMKNRGIEIVTQYDCNDEVYLHKNIMIQVFLNILKNSYDNFIEKGIKNPKITIKTYKDSDNYIIEICDNGGGIKEEILPKIFDLYYSTKDNKDGTGLGLYISKIIVEEQNKGKIYAKNTNDGICFIIILDKKELLSKE